MKRSCIIILLCLIYIMICDVPVMADNNGKICISGMMSDDLIEFYRIAVYNENNEYTWVSNVSKYLASSNMESVLNSPAELSILDIHSAKQFCKNVILGVKKNSDGKPDIPLIERTGSTTYSFDMAPGFYIVVVNGTERIYDIKFVEIKPQQTGYIDYVAEDYNIPEVNLSLENITQDRQTDDTGAKWTQIDDKIQMQAVINLPLFYEIYSDSKNCFNNVIVSLPEGVDYEEKSISIKGLVQNEEIQLLENKDYIMTEMEDFHCFEISLKNTVSFSGIKIICNTKKNVIGSKTGSLDFEVKCEYSKSPLDSECIGKVKNTASICFYGINFVSCAGDGITDITDEEDVLKNAKRLSGTAIDVYKYRTSVPIYDEVALQKAVIELGDMKYYTITSENVDEKLIYTYVGTVETDENGEASVGGLTIGDYLVTESQPPKGYDFFSSFQKVSKEEWSNQEISDNHYMVSTMLINYKGMILPGSGERKEWKFWIVGGVIVIAVIAIRVRVAYKNSTKNNILYK